MSSSACKAAATRVHGVLDIYVPHVFASMWFTPTIKGQPVQLSTCIHYACVTVGKWFVGVKHALWTRLRRSLWTGLSTGSLRLVPIILQLLQLPAPMCRHQSTRCFSSTWQLSFMLEHQQDTAILGPSLSDLLGTELL